MLKTTIASLPALFLPRSIVYNLYKEIRNRNPVPLAERTTPVEYEKISPFSVSTCVLCYLLYHAPVLQEECSGHTLSQHPTPWPVSPCEHRAMRGHGHRLAGWRQEP